MPLIRRFLSVCLLLSTVAAAPLWAQEATPTPEPEPPVLSKLDPSWWAYFDGEPEQIKPRVDAFLATANDEISGLGARNQEIAPAIVEAVADNFDVYLALLEDVDFETKVLPEAATTYTLDDLLGVAAAARDADDAASAADSEVEREQRILDGATRRRDALFKDYLGSAEGDERWLTGLRLIRARTAQAIAARRLEVLTQNASDATEYADEIATRVELVRERLAMDPDETALAALIETLDALRDAVSGAEERRNRIIL